MEKSAAKREKGRKPPIVEIKGESGNEVTPPPPDVFDDNPPVAPPPAAIAAAGPILPFVPPPSTGVPGADIYTREQLAATGVNPIFAGPYGAPSNPPANVPPAPPTGGGG